ncbi:hypothetical protein [Streptosporangium carneum]|uniref:DUF2637 domain-containing protein n=1 Tax=Streptosporangium carneum TaxID=47481 RepID=A0A9W6I9N2_9ACTN|nr:hypothetical protein [Streptosporangium carneum]GLK13733.1 hypothetical protein GCM10017600_71440 [Streptosporangium carneum]
MDVKSPEAADTLSRPSSTPPSQTSRVTVALRRAGIALVGLGVAALTAAACVLSFEDLRGLAVVGEAPAHLAYLYPAAFDALLAIALISVLLLRGGRWPVRLQAGAVLALLFAAAVAAEVTTAVRATVDVRRAAVVVAVAPWVTLLLALWLWLLLISHAAARRAAADAASARLARDIVPFPEADLPTAEYPAPRGRDAAPAHGERRARAAHPDSPDRPDHVPHPVHHPPSEVLLDPQAAPPMESAPHHDLPVTQPVVGPTPAPETPEIAEPPARSPEAPQSSESPEAAESPEASAPPRASAAPDRPLRWGDLVRPHHGDLLVHPPRPAARKPESRVSERVETWDADRPSPEEPQERESREERPEIGDRDSDTQPMAVVTDDSAPASRAARTSRPAREDDAADTGQDAAPETLEAAETSVRTDADTDESEKREAEGEGAAAPPSGRMRSTPTPPEES